MKKVFFVISFILFISCILLIATGECQEAASSQFEQNIVLGDSAIIEAQEVIELEDDTGLLRAETFYSMVIKKVGVVDVDTMFFLQPAIDILMDSDSLQSMILNGNFIDTVGDYEIYGWASRFVALNPEGNRWKSGEMSDILLARVYLGEDNRRPKKWLIKFKE